jgi:hypothetical protein
MAAAKEFLQEIKAGDAIVISRGSAFPVRVAQVSRITATQIVISDTEKYHRVDGRRVGGLGGYIERIATAKDLSREADKNRKRQVQSAAIQADYDRRKELERLFSEPLVASLSSGLAGDGTFELGFHGLTEEMVRALAKRLKDWKP